MCVCKCECVIDVVKNRISHHFWRTSDGSPKICTSFRRESLWPVAGPSKRLGVTALGPFYCSPQTPVYPVGQLMQLETSFCFRERVSHLDVGPHSSVTGVLFVLMLCVICEKREPSMPVLVALSVKCLQCWGNCLRDTCLPKHPQKIYLFSCDRKIHPPFFLFADEKKTALIKRNALCSIAECHIGRALQLQLWINLCLSGGSPENMHIPIITSNYVYLSPPPKEEGSVFTSVCLSVCLLVCPLDYSKSYERILTEVFGGMGHGVGSNI